MYDRGWSAEKWLKMWDMLNQEDLFPIIDITNEELLEIAVEEENYEEAARLRDLINEENEQHMDI
jgi:protein-arginine kinase activator protein McsA